MGRKHDFKDTERLVRRLIANELILSFVPNGEQRIWRGMTRMKLQLTRSQLAAARHPRVESHFQDARLHVTTLADFLERRF